MTRITTFNDCPKGWDKLQAAKEQAHTKLPPLTDLQRQKLSRISGYAAYRLVNFLIANQGTRTDKVSPAIAIQNVPDVAMKMRPQLLRLGLDVECLMLKTKNRYGNDVAIGTWWLRVIDFTKWFGTKAANDESA